MTLNDNEFYNDWPAHTGRVNMTQQNRQPQPSRDRAEMRLFIATEGYSHTQVLVAQSEKELDKLCKLKGMSVYRTHIAKLRTQQQSPGERKGKVK